MLRRIKRKRTLLLTAAFLLVVAGVAYGYWTTTGSGSGSATTGTPVGITVTQTTTVAGLYPGAAAQSLAGKFNNTNSGAAQVHQVSATIGTPTGPNIDGTHPCTASDYTLSGFPVTVDAEVPTGTAVGAWTGGSIQMVDSASNQDGCKGATVPITYSSN